MRLLVRDLVPVHVFTAHAVDESDPDFYPGTQPEQRYSHTLRCNVQPAENRATAEVFGVKVYDMVSILCERDAKLAQHDMVSLAGTEKATHRIVSVKPYQTHLVCLAEKVMG